jgi:RNA-binding protein
MLQLTAVQRQTLKGRAHRLHPIIMVGAAGLTPEVLNEIDLALKSHELIKIRVLNEDPSGRKSYMDEICRVLGAAPVQHIGKMLVLFRPRPPEPPAASQTAPKQRAGKSKRRVKRSYQMG